MATEPVPEWPSEWPDVSKVSLRCDDVVGAYVDPNTTYWHEKKLENGVIEGLGGRSDAAWLVFGFKASLVLGLDQTKKSRSFSFAFDNDRNINIDYFIDKSRIASKSIAPRDYACHDGKLDFVSYERSGEVFDKFPNHGTIRWSVSVFRIGNSLYVKKLATTKAVFLGFIPKYQSGSLWYRYEASP